MDAVRLRSGSYRIPTPTLRAGSLPQTAPHSLPIRVPASFSTKTLRFPTLFHINAALGGGREAGGEDDLHGLLGGVDSGRQVGGGEPSGWGQGEAEEGRGGEVVVQAEHVLYRRSRWSGLGQYPCRLHM